MGDDRQAVRNGLFDWPAGRKWANSNGEYGADAPERQHHYGTQIPCDQPAECRSYKLSAATRLAATNPHPDRARWRPKNHRAIGNLPEPNHNRRRSVHDDHAVGNATRFRVLTNAKQRGHQLRRCLALARMLPQAGAQLPDSSGIVTEETQSSRQAVAKKPRLRRPVQRAFIRLDRFARSARVEQRLRVRTLHAPASGRVDHAREGECRRIMPDAVARSASRDAGDDQRSNSDGRDPYMLSRARERPP